MPESENVKNKEEALIKEVEELKSKLAAYDVKYTELATAFNRLLTEYNNLHVSALFSKDMYKDN